MVFDVDEESILEEVTSTLQKYKYSSDAAKYGRKGQKQLQGGDEIGSSIAESQSFNSESDNDDVHEDTSTKQENTTESNITNQPMHEMQQYAAMENKLVNRWRRIVNLSILVAGAIVGALTFVTLNNEQIRDSTDAFTLFANTINDSFQFRVKAIFEANRGLSREVTTSAKEHNGRFPYYSVPTFEAKAYDARKHAGLDAIIFAPIVINEKAWINFTQNARGWLDDSKFIFDILEPGQNRSLEPNTPPLPPYIWSFNQEDGLLEQRSGRGNFVPSFHISPPPVDSGEILLNIDLFSEPNYKSVSVAAVRLKDALFSKFDPTYADYVSKVTGKRKYLDDEQHPRSIAAQPVYNSLDSSTHKIVGYLYSIISWEYYLFDLLPKGVNGIYVVLRNSCNQSVTYQLFGNEAAFVAENDVHDRSFDMQRRTIDFTTNYFDPALTSYVDGHCQIFLDVYPSDLFIKSYESALPIIFTILVVILFISMAAIFSTYDRFVQARNTKVVGAAARSSAIVSSLFPEAVRERLMAQQKDDAKSRNFKGFLAADKSELSSENRSLLFQTKPIADLFPETTIIFADIVNFTAWSSVRDPSQVFTLLETVYNAFDDIARKRRVFKVETIGDCYVAVCGLPEPAKDHALRMARFAKDCMRKMWDIVKSLESTLGPDTGDLTMRMGLHSGPVTAGVLRGERSRFQLFGDTMNTAARMESTGFPDCIQISQDTADLLIAAGKLGWITPRSDMVNAKGKGLMQTYLLDMNKKSTRSSHGDDSIVDSTEYSDGMRELTETAYPSFDFALPNIITSKNSRLVEWITEILLGLIKDIAVRRNHDNRWKAKSTANLVLKINDCHVIDEVKEIIALPGICSSDKKNDAFNPIVDIDPRVGEQLRHYIARIAAMYPENSFHNFEHASHVTMSVQKLLARIIAPSDLDRAYEIKSLGADNTYGITSDPLTQFSCVFSAVIHDVDHPGVPNTVLVSEKTELAEKYQNKSIAEQNSVDLAWNLLMSSQYHTLRSAICSNEVEMKRFRQLVVNSVMATDIADKDQKVFRNARWDRAFHENVIENEQDSINRKATIVIEHLIQASDVSHTMQHWHIYRKWNQRFFEECYKAYKMGRSDTDPSLNWYQGEIGFFDFYIIPLAKKLKDCGVFGVSSNEYLNYAIQNRNEWKDRGQEIVLEMMEHVRTIEHNNINTSINITAERKAPMKKFSSRLLTTVTTATAQQQTSVDTGGSSQPSVIYTA